MFIYILHQSDRQWSPFPTMVPRTPPGESRQGIAASPCDCLFSQGMLWRSVREVTVSKRRGRLGASEEDQDLVNAALISQYDDEFSVPRLTKRVAQDAFRRH